MTKLADLTRVKVMKRFFIVIFSLSIFVNLVLLDIAFLHGGFSPLKKEVIPTPVVKTEKTSTPDSFCPSSCTSLIKQATESSKAIALKQQPSSHVGSRETFITFGSGINSSEDWQDVSGLEAYINTANYGAIKAVTLEASIHVPTGNQTADVRLFNATDQHPVWFSEMHFDGGSTAKLLTSQNLTLDPGDKLYKVQMKTQLKFQANLDSSRLRITTY